MGILHSKKYDVEGKQKGFDHKSSAVPKKSDSSTLQLKSEVRKSIEATQQRNAGIYIGETATTSKDIENNISGNPESQTNVKTRTLENEETNFEKMRIKLKDDHDENAQSEENVIKDTNEQTQEIIEESSKIEPPVEIINKEESNSPPEIIKNEISSSEESKESGETKIDVIKKVAPDSSIEVTQNQMSSSEKSNESGKIAAEIEEIKKEESDLSVEIIQNEISSLEKTQDEDTSVTKDMKDQIIEEMIRIVNQPKHEENEDAKAQPGNIKTAKVEETPTVSSVYTIEENYRRLSENENEIDVQQNKDEKGSVAEKTEDVETEDNKIQTEYIPESIIKKVSISEEPKKKVRIEIPNQNEALATKGSDGIVENKTENLKQDETTVENIEENQPVRKVEEQETNETKMVIPEAEQEIIPIVESSPNTEIKVEVHKRKEENEGNVKVEENSTHGKEEEQNQSDNVMDVHIEEHTLKGNIQQMEENKIENKTQEDDETIQKAVSEIPTASTEEKVKVEEAISNSENEEKIPKEETLSSAEILSVKLQESESAQGQAPNQEETVISEDTHPALQKIQAIEKDTKALRERIIGLTGDSKEEYFALHEALIKNVLKLDDLSVENANDIRSERKRVIKFVQDCLNTLERNVGKPKDSEDSDLD